MVKPEKCGHLYLVYHFTVPLKDFKPSSHKKTCAITTIVSTIYGIYIYIYILYQLTPTLTAATTY